MKTDLGNAFGELYSTFTAMLPNIIVGLVVIILFIIMGKLFHRFIGRRIQRRWEDSIISNFVSEAAKWSFYIFGFIIALNIVGFGGVAGSLVAGAGIGAIVIGFAFKDIGENFLSGIILAIKRPFEIGDIIEVDGYKGKVEDLDLRLTHLRNFEGKDIYIPNATIIKNTLINFTRDGFLRINFSLGIAPECSIDTTRILIMDYFGTNTQVLKKPAPYVLVEELGEFTIDLQVLFWVNIMNKNKLPDSYMGHTIRSKVIADIKSVLDSNGIEMPSQVLEHKMYRDHTLKVNKES
ncbi:MAG: mechanosensitive ion channel family protein [Bacteroidia bacterium]|nr:mechanosensitive ion channel family protein [Bacteroidia bacterium]NNF29767.1 mechanosensitive ion channel family protein [Flavobacteriaceae bacterium]MBT8274691.1 mechanosensitive ion channel family protein [Bacteroidia bacterium]NNJ82754.1 mechanosensitive ion channel family protein [Flavobacteriaceae bacterium]NNK55384.1 mechanosensitive ion channel family protein [Flavobacteriaceae bacterium]